MYIKTINKKVQEYKAVYICCFCFILYKCIDNFLAQGMMAHMAYKAGNPYQLFYGTDTFGNVCNQKNEKIPNVALSGQDLTGKS